MVNNVKLFRNILPQYAFEAIISIGVIKANKICTTHPVHCNNLKIVELYFYTCRDRPVAFKDIAHTVHPGSYRLAANTPPDQVEGLSSELTIVVML